MSLNPQEFTDKTNKMIEKARALATGAPARNSRRSSDFACISENCNVAMEPLHLAAALVMDEDGLARRVLEKTGLHAKPLLQHA